MRLSASQICFSAAKAMLKSSYLIYSSSSWVARKLPVLCTTPTLTKSELSLNARSTTLVQAACLFKAEMMPQGAEYSNQGWVCPGSDNCNRYQIWGKHMVLKTREGKKASLVSSLILSLSKSNNLQGRSYKVQVSNSHKSRVRALLLQHFRSLPLFRAYFSSLPRWQKASISFLPKS